jgi:ornithine carbamoyltransferase
MARHLLDLADLGPTGVLEVVDLAMAPTNSALAGLGVAMVFEKPSARTRNSTEMAVVDLGGHPVMISDAEVAIDRRETAEDVARTLGCYHRILAARVNDHRILGRMAAALDAQAMDVSVVNLLSDASHPCQAIADVLTLADEFAHGGDLAALAGRRVAYVGDANNVTRSLAQALLAVGVDLAIASPEGYGFDGVTLDELGTFGSGTGASVVQHEDPMVAVAGADAIYGDVWVSMGQEAEAAERLRAFAGYQIDGAMVAGAHDDAIVLHCLPAHRGEEIAADVLESSASRVWRQAAHRRTAMRGVLRWLLAESGR